MNSESTLQTETQDDFGRQNTLNFSQLDFPLYQSTQQMKQSDKYQNDYSAAYYDNSLQEEDSKDEESYQGNQTQESGCMETRPFDQDSYQQQYLKQYQTQNVNKQYLQREKPQNMFSNSFDESAPSLDLKPQRNCKSSTRMMNKTQKRQAITPSIPVPLIHNLSNGSGVINTGSLSRKQGGGGVFNTFMKTKQMQNSYQQAILNQLQRNNTQNSFDMKNDLSNRSLVQGQKIVSNSFLVNQYFGNTLSNKPITPHNINSGNTQVIQQMILSAGGQMPRNSQNMNASMDPYTYLRWKQQKYKSSRSIQTGNQFQKQNPQIISNSAYLMHQRKGNQTQKTNNNNKSICSSNGSALGSASMTTTMTGIKSLSEVKNPQMFISWRFSDRKLTELKDIGQFKNLTDLDISGNLLQNEVQELKTLQFLKKLNLSNNQISELYPLPHNLEILNISQNCLKQLNSEVCSNLKNLTTIDVSNNGLELLNGIDQMKRLKRLLCKNNQILDLKPLQELETLIELDLENNPFDSYPKLCIALQNKSDILVMNCKMTPLMLMIASYDQFLQEIANQDALHQEQIKKRLKFFSNGTLYRSKRVYLKIKTMQQHSKRSSSNFSNGSSSCGRAGTGGRTQVNHNSNAFSPLLNNTVTTPNYQYTTQRFEDIEQMYDEILDEEEELQRKNNRVHKKKHEDGSEDDEEDLSLYEDDHPSMSCEEDIDELQSYRNQNVNHPQDFLNESTADFNKEIRQINQELKDEFLVENLEHIQSQHSTSTNKKNPIFKLDLSKCTQQQSEEDEQAENEEEDQFDIPGLQFVKVTDDSFRQIQKQQSQQQSVRNKIEIQESKKNTLREYPPKPQQKQIIIPKLQLGILQQQQNIPIKHQQSYNSLNPTNSKKSLQSIKSFKEEQKTAEQHLKEELDHLKKQYQTEQLQSQDELKSLRAIIQEIKDIFNYTQELQNLPSFIRIQYQRLNEDSKLLKKNCEELENKYSQLKTLRKTEQERIQQLEDNEKTILKLKEQLSLRESMREINNFELKRTQSTQYEGNSAANLLNNPQLFYQTDKDSSLRIQNQNEIENLNSRSRKQFKCDIKKIKRPQSVVGQRKSSYCIKINSLIKGDSHGINGNTSNIDETQYNNEYGSTAQDYHKSSDKSNLSQTMNKKVGHYIERLKERNSSLQERLNGSFSSNQQSLPTKVSPLNLQKVNLNLTQQQEMLSNPYIMSPSNDSQKNLVPHTVTHQQSLPQKVSNFTNHIMASSKPLQDSQLILKHNNESSSSIIEYSGREYNTQQPPQSQQSQHSKTQRIQIKKIQYNQFFLQNQTQQRDDKSSLVIKPRDPNDSDYQINLSSLSSKDKNNSFIHQQMGNNGEGLNFYPSKKTERVNNTQNIEQSFRESQNVGKSQKIQNNQYNVVGNRQNQ